MGKLLIATMLLTCVCEAEAPLGAIKLWPKGVPGAKVNTGAEHDTTTAKDNMVAGKPVVRLGDVSEPTLTFYPVGDLKDAATVVVFPGGGYRILAWDLEGTEICQWLNSIGLNAALVKYRVPSQPNLERYAAPLQDAQRAVGLVREHAQDWRVDAARVGVLGFSAGGHLAALVSNSYATRSYAAMDAADQVSCKPDFTILIYPAYLAVGPKLDELAKEFSVTANTPPAFLIQTEDDPVHVENSIAYYRALKDAKVPAEMHLFSNGGHGYGMRPDPQKPVTDWPRLAETWLKARGLAGR